MSKPNVIFIIDDEGRIAVEVGGERIYPHSGFMGQLQIAIISKYKNRLVSSASEALERAEERLDWLRESLDEAGLG